MPEDPRKKRKIEHRYVYEWLMTFHPTALQWRRVRLGPLPFKELYPLAKITLRWVDAIYIENNVVHIVEAKLRPDLGAISQLKHYARLFPETPEFQQFKDWPIKKILLIPYPWKDLVEAARMEGIEVVVWRPAWLKLPAYAK